MYYDLPYPNFSKAVVVYLMCFRNLICLDQFSPKLWLGVDTKFGLLRLIFLSLKYTFKETIGTYDRVKSDLPLIKAKITSLDLTSHLSKTLKR